MTEKKRFFAITLEEDQVTEFQSKTPRDAALKAASKGQECIILCHENKVYIFQGLLRSLTESENNEFTKSKSIQHRPVVKRLGYTKLERNVDPRKASDLEYIQETVRNFR